MRNLLVSALFLALLPVTANAAGGEPGQGNFSAMATYMDDDKDRGVDDEFGGGQIGLGIALHKYWNLEAYVQAGSYNGFAPQDHFGVGIDLQYLLNRDGRLSPYFFGGLGYLEIQPEGSPRTDAAMYSGGVGLLARIFGDSDVAVRAEYRIRGEDNQPSRLYDDLVSIGLHIPFGATKPKFIDSDGDGVGDAMDRCPMTPRGVTVDARGCEVDSDGDGVKDSMDQCPNTARGATVNAQGCEVDSDGDGVKDSMDNCPNTPRGATVNAQGCELDDDNDGVVNRLDRCPNTAAGVAVDVAGCEIKEEIDLPGVTFESNSDRLLPGAERVLNDAAATLVRNPQISVEVAGHTDSDGAAAYNESLSERRASTVRDYLANRGVPMSRMTVRGYGEAEPIASNATAAGKAENRRVVLRITER